MRPFDPRLRDYQVDTIEKIHARLGEHGSTLAVMGTGVGKTATALSYARSLGLPTLWIAHREELIDQAARAATTWWPEASTGVVMAARNEVHADLVVASVQTIAKPKRLARLPRFGLIVIDEVHRARAQSYEQVIEALGAGQPGGPTLLGLTATPDRSDGRGLGELFASVAVNLDVIWAIKHGHLCNVRAKSIDLGIDLSKVKSRGGDFVESDLEREMRAVDSTTQIVTAWLEHGENRKTVAMLPTVSMAQELADAFNDAGVPAAAVWGDMAKDDRRRTLAAHQAGRLKMLTSVGVLIEGYDDPTIEAVLIARPTKSRLLYTQAAGRALRTSPGKESALIIDLVGAAQIHSLVSARDLLGVHVILEGETATEAFERDATEQAAEKAMSYEQMQAEWRDGTERMLDVDPIGRPKDSRYIWEHAPIATVETRWEAHAKAHHVVIRPNTVRSAPHAGDPKHPWIAAAFGGDTPYVIHTGPLRKVRDKAERWLDGNGGIRPVSMPDDPASPKQRGFLRSLGYDGDVRELSRADAGKHITRLVRARDAGAMAEVKANTPEQLAVLLNDGKTPEQLAARYPVSVREDVLGIFRSIAGVAESRGLLERQDVAS